MVNGNNLPAKKGKSEVLKEIVEQGTGRIPKKGGYYEPKPGKFEPDAMRVQEEANEEYITTRAVYVKQTSKYALAITEAENSKGQKVQGVVNHDFEVIFNLKVMEMFKKVHAGEVVMFGKKGHREKIEVFNDIKNPFIYGPEGRMIPNLTGMGMVKLLDDMLRFQNFSLRDATTKSMRIAQQKILNREWREQEEIEAEETEVKDINKSEEVKKTNQEEIDKVNNKKAEAQARREETENKQEEETETEKRDNKNEQEPEEEKKEEQTTETETQEAKERAEERKEQIKNQPIDGNEDKGIQTKIMDDTDELTKAEVKEMEPEEIGRHIVKQMEAKGEELKPSNFGSHIMGMKRKRWIPARKYDKLREWFLNTQM